MEDGWETLAPPPPPPAARDAPTPDTPAIEVADEELVEDEEKTLVFDLPKQPPDITKEMFDDARGHLETVRPPPSVSVSFKDLEKEAKQREDLTWKISLTVGRRDRLLSFTADVSTETLQKIASVIVNRAWLKDAASMREVILHLCRAYDPERYVNLDKKDDEALYDEFLTMLVEEVKRPKLAQSLSRKRAEAQGEEPQRKRR